MSRESFHTTWLIPLVNAQSRGKGGRRKKSRKEKKRKKDGKRSGKCTFKSPPKVILNALWTNGTHNCETLLWILTMPMIGSKNAWFFLAMGWVLPDTLGHKGSFTNRNSIPLLSSSKCFDAPILHDLQGKIQNVKEHYEARDLENVYLKTPNILPHFSLPDSL